MGEFACLGYAKKGNGLKYIYGPVNSRRLGYSLGLSLTPFKACSFDCVYCQLGRTTDLTVKRKKYIDIKEILKELSVWLKENKIPAKKLDYITLSGMGEPTLNSDIAGLIKGIRKITSLPVAVITNSTFLKDYNLRQALLKADLIVPSLDAVDQDVFEKIDKPKKGIKVEDIIKGLIILRKEFKDKIWLEIMLVKGINDSIAHIKKLKTVIDMIKPDRIQLNSPVRRTAVAGVEKVSDSRLKQIKKILGSKCEVY